MAANCIRRRVRIQPQLLLDGCPRGIVVLLRNG